MSYEVKLEKRIESLLSTKESVDKIYDACGYMLKGQGKRIRPRIVLAILEDFSLDLNLGIDAAIAIEFIHTSSLIHDDLPSLDNDELRRGKASCHIEFGEDIAILTADFLIAWAYELLINSELADDLKLKLIKSLSHSFQEVCHGQVLDLSEGDPEISKVHNLKTASLFELCFYYGAAIANLSEKEVSLLSSFGKEFGLYFQQLNDYLDQAKDPSLTGRNYSSDQKNAKKTQFANLLPQEQEASIKEKFEVVNSKLENLKLELANPLENLSQLLSELKTMVIKQCEQ